MARAEGEGFADAGQWRAAHERFWARWNAEVAAFLGLPQWSPGDQDRVVVEWFAVRAAVAALEPGGHPHR